MSGEEDFRTMLLQIEQLAGENAVLEYIISTTSSNPRGFEEFYPIGVKQRRFGFMAQAMEEDEQPFQGKLLRRKYDFLG